MKITESRRKASDTIDAIWKKIATRETKSLQGKTLNNQEVNDSARIIRYWRDKRYGK